MAEATLEDAARAEEYRRNDEEAYAEYLKDRQELLSKKNEVFAEWEIYKDLYAEWVATIKHINLIYPKAFNNHSNIDLCIEDIYAGAWYPYNTITVKECLDLVIKGAESIHNGRVRSEAIAEEAIQFVNDIFK